MAKRRLGGDIVQMEWADGRRVIVKSGRGAQRAELLRERRNALALQGVLPIPVVVEYQDDGETATLIETCLPGRPLHVACKDIGRDSTLECLAAVLNAMRKVPRAAIDLGPSVDEELAEVAGLIREGLVDESTFHAITGGRSVEDAFAEVAAQIAAHHPHDFVHGDFCLPNIMLDEDGSWGLVDLGRCGFGDRARDVASLEKSLRRNVDGAAFADLLASMKLHLGEADRDKMRTYTLLDAFWESVPTSSAVAEGTLGRLRD